MELLNVFLLNYEISFKKPTSTWVIVNKKEEGEKEAEEAGEREEESIRGVERMRKKTILLSKSLLRDGNT